MEMNLVEKYIKNAFYIGNLIALHKTIKVVYRGEINNLFPIIPNTVLKKNR